MASQDELDRAKFLKEKQEYLDARSAYEQVLNRVANGMLSPASTLSSYSVASGGYERAATDPWMVEKHPDLSAAAERLAKEEQDYLALDEPVANHAQGNCSIAAYTAAKFYEYVAMAEMLYKLATDSDFRQRIVDKLGEAVSSGGFLSDFFIMLGSGIGANERAMAGMFDNEKINDANDAVARVQSEATARTFQRFGAYFSERWQAFKNGWEECGLANAVAKAGIDGLFLVGEVIVGGAVLKGVRFSYRLVREGVHRVEIVSVEKGTLGGHNWSTDALENKYGKPNENQVAGLLPDQNRTIKDGPAQPPSSNADTDNKARTGGAFTQKQLDTAAEYGVDPKWVDADGKLIYPTAAHGFPDGFDGPIESTTLKPGEIIDRYGSPTGKFFSTPGTPFEQRAMALSNKYDNTPRVYRVLKEIPVHKGKIAPWFDQPGGGTQFLTEMGEKELRDGQYIEVVEDAPFR